MVSGTRVVTDRKTDFARKLDCKDLQSGLRIKVKGKGQADGTVLAQRIERE
jgi:hypothetical protein